MPETDDARYERVLWLSVVRRAQEEARGERLISSDHHQGSSETVKRQARRWILSCRGAGCRSKVECKQFRRVCELAGFNETQIQMFIQSTEETSNDSESKRSTDAGNSVAGR